MSQAIKDIKVKLHQWLEDFDNSELNEEDWQEAMENALISFNEENNTQFSTSTILSYKMMKIRKQEEQ